MLKKNNYTIQDGIKVFDYSDNITGKVITFYHDDPFPNYEISDDKLAILKKVTKIFLHQTLKNL